VNVDLRAYYQQLREVEASITDECVIVVSSVTPDGGRAGIRTEVTRPDAARMIVEGRARLATAEESRNYRSELRENKQRIDEAAAAARLQVTVISDSELRSMRDRIRPSKV
jgi:hypothetical protein